jgi:hypothetical protein
MTRIIASDCGEIDFRTPSPRTTMTGVRRDLVEHRLSRDSKKESGAALNTRRPIAPRAYRQKRCSHPPIVKPY